MSRKKTPSQPDPDGNLDQEEAAAENAEATAESETEVAVEGAAGDDVAPEGESDDAGDPAADEASAGDDSETADESEAGEATAPVAELTSDEEATAPGTIASDDSATAADEAASEEEAVRAEPATPLESARPLAARVRRMRPPRLGAAVPLLAAAGIAGVAAVLWWQFLQGYVSGESNGAAGDDSAAVSPISDGGGVAADDGEGIEAALRALDARIAILGEELTASRAELEVRVDRAEALLEDLPARFAALERRVNAVQGSTREARESLLREEAEYYLTIANTELDVAGRWESASSALQIADDNLRELANPALRPVREAIADELIALNSVERPDIEGIVITLGRLLEQAPDLPLRPGGPNRFAAPETGLDDAQPGLDRLWLGVQNALRSIVSVERREAPVAPVLTAAEQQLARRQLQLELQLARFAATSGRQEGFASGVVAARALLERDFDAESVAVENAVTLLDELVDIDVAPVRPDISGSLRVLRALAAEGD